MFIITTVWSLLWYILLAILCSIQFHTNYLSLSWYHSITYYYYYSTFIHSLLFLQQTQLFLNVCLFRCFFSLLLHLLIIPKPHPDKLTFLQLLLHILAYRIKPLVRHRLLGGQPILQITFPSITHIMVINQRFIKVVKQIVIYKFLCRGIDELLPIPSREVRQQAFGLPVQP